MSEIRHAFYSAKQAKLCGVVRYRTADGRILEASNVCQTMDTKSNWDDLVYLGEVVEFVDRLGHGEMGDMHDLEPVEFLRRMRIIQGTDKAPDKSKLN